MTPRTGPRPAGAASETAGRLRARRAWAGLFAAASAVAAAQPAGDTTFWSGPELGARLLRNVVSIETRDPPEHGFGLVIGASGSRVYVATAAHVVRDGERMARGIEVAFCDGAPPGRVPAEAVRGLDAGGFDLAVLELPRPAGYELQPRVLAAPEQLAPRQPAWLLGQDGGCGLSPGEGAIAALRDDRDNLRVEFGSVRGGASGGPVLGGHGVLGLVTDAGDLSVVVLSADAIAERLRPQLPRVWQIERARNIPPSDPRAAQIDLAETLNRYLVAGRDLQGLLLQPSVPRPRFVAFAQTYNDAVNRFRDARDRYDGALAVAWAPDVLPRWQDLRDALWQVHLTFRALNDGEAKQVFDNGRASEALQARMRALEAPLTALQQDIEGFLKRLSRKDGAP